MEDNDSVKDKQIEDLKARVAKLESQLAELESQLKAALEKIATLGKNSRNSSKPPSSAREIHWAESVFECCTSRL